MIPLRKEHTLSQHGYVGKSTDYTIIATPEMLDVLSSGIYKDPIKATVRETLTNAADEGDFSVTTPSSLVPYFKVRDHGRGMSPEFIEKNYTTYGFSDKNLDNIKRGGLGLGCKAPFSYTDTFTVRSWWKGVVSTYECVKKPDGTYSTTLRGSRASDETGTEVIVPVKTQDYHTFRDQINHFSNYLSFFSGVNIKGVDIAPDRFEHVKGDLYKTTSAHQLLTVVMGGIPYHCDSDEILKDTSLLGSNYFVIKQPIGSLNITASRESIRYSEDTVKKLKPVITQAVDDLVSVYKAEYDALPNEWEKYKWCKNTDPNIAAHIMGTRFFSPPKMIHTERVDVNSAGSVKTNYYLPDSDLVCNRYGYGAPPTHYILIDIDKFVPSRIKTVWQTYPSSALGYFRPLKDGSDSIKELNEIGVPYSLLSTYERMKSAPRVKQPKTSGPSVTKGEALVVYYKPNAGYYDSKYTSEQKLDLDNPGNVCYYDRKDEGKYTNAMQYHSLLKDTEYKAISATSKNLTKLKNAGIKHIDDVIQEWVKAGNQHKEDYIHSYINAYHSDWVDVDFNKLSLRVDFLFTDPPKIGGCPEWGRLPTFITDNFQTSVAINYMREIDKKIQYLKGLKVKTFTGTDVPLFDLLKYDSNTLTQLEVE